MKKNIKKIISLVLVLAISLAISVPAFATSSASIRKDSSLSDIDLTLLKFGYDKDILTAMGTDKKEQIASAIKKDPSNVQVSGSICEINELQSLESFVNSSDQQLLSKGLSKEEIDKNRKWLDNLSKTSDAELASTLNRNKEEAKLIRMAITPAANYNEKKLEGTVVTPSGTIGTAKLDFYMTVLNRTDATTPQYYVYNSFKWLQTPVLNLDDTVTVGWGGDLATTNISSTGSYDNGLDTNEHEANTNEGPINAGLAFTFPRQVDSHVLRSGETSFDIYQNEGLKNHKTKVISIFGHEILQVSGGASVSVSGLSPSISLGLGWDYSAQKRASITV